MVHPARSISNPYVEKWKEQGKKVIGYPCTYVPEEIIHAASMMPSSQVSALSNQPSQVDAVYSDSTFSMV